jgi:hypothetical protein
MNSSALKANNASHEKYTNTSRLSVTRVTRKGEAFQSNGARRIGDLAAAERSVALNRDHDCSFSIADELHSS